jgi:hypothetical protein
MAMAEQPAGYHPEVLEDLKAVLASCRLFSDLGMPVQFWEGLWLFKTKREIVIQELDRLPRLREAGRPAEIDAALFGKLQVIRERLGPLARKLGPFLAGLPEVRIDRDGLDLLIGFITVADKGREAAARWVAEPERTAEEARAKLRSMLLTVEAYARALREWRSEPPPAPLESAVFEAPSPMEPLPAEPPAPEATAPPAPAEPSPPPPAPDATGPPRVTEAIPGVDPEILEDVRRVQQCREIFEATHQQIEVWEVFCLVMLDRESTARTLEDLLRLKGNGDSAAFNDGALGLFDRLLRLRAQYEKLVRPLRAYLERLPVGTFGLQTREMALGFVVVSPRGRQRAQQWLDEPERFKQEAAGRWEDIISRAMRYETALRMSG